jgi:hypothetical protein
MTSDGTEASMPTITRNGFQDTFEHGISLDDPDLASGLQGTGVTLDRLRRADRDHDGVISRGPV